MCAHIIEIVVQLVEKFLSQNLFYVYPNIYFPLLLGENKNVSLLPLILVKKIMFLGKRPHYITFLKARCVHLSSANEIESEVLLGKP